MIYIYALLNPIDNNIFYIGATKSPKLRLLTHKYSKNKIIKYKGTVLSEISSNGLKPEMIILEECLPEYVCFIENFYIELFSFYGFNLNQSKTSTYSHGGFTPLPKIKESFKNRIKGNDVYCTMAFNLNGSCTDVRFQYSKDDYTENKAKFEMREYYRNLNYTLIKESQNK